MNITFTVFRVITITIRVYNFKNILKYNQQVIIFTVQKKYEGNGTEFQYIQKISKIIPKTENIQGHNHNPTKNNNQPHSRNDRNTVRYFFRGIRIKYRTITENYFMAAITIPQKIIINLTAVTTVTRLGIYFKGSE